MRPIKAVSFSNANSQERTVSLFLTLRNRIQVLVFILFQIFLTTSVFSDELESFRKRPGARGDFQGLRSEKTFDLSIYDSVPESESSASDFVPIRDRWSMLYKGKWYDPYNQNILKGDLPIFGEPGSEWFFEALLISDSLFEHRNVPTAIGLSTTSGSQGTDVLGDYQQSMFVQNLFTRFSLIRGNTVFKPPAFELRVAPVFNINHVNVDERGILRADPSRGTHRDDADIGFQELLVDIHLADISHRYDFISSRVGIQRFSSDFRGFVFTDDAPGVRLFGTWDNNKYQYNLAWFSRLDKDPNSLLNTMSDRHEEVVVANVYAQDALVLGHTLQFSFLHREDRAGNHGVVFDKNGFIVRPASLGSERPKNVSSTYLGFNTDGHIGRLNTTSSVYYVFGSESNNALADRGTDISAWMAALELSYDFDWIRARSSFFFSSGDQDPFDGKAEGFDSINDVPNFAGGDLSYWQRQGIPLIAGGGVALVNRLSLLPDLTAGKELGQSNFVNPGLFLYNLGIDFELTPKLKLINNASYLHFHHTDTLETLRQDGSLNREIGFDFSSGFLYRPFLNNNVQIRVGTAALVPGSGLKNLYGDKVLYDVFTNLILLY